MKNRIGISSGDFLDKYTDMTTDAHSRFPMVKLQMKPNGTKACPFVTPDGCTIYEDRPGACRIYPLGRASAKPDGKRDVMEKFFIVGEEHCLGFQEEKEWTIDEWLKNEGIYEYNSMNDPWSEIITSTKGLGPPEDVRRKIQMFVMACYNIDKFRDFIFNSKFLDLFNIETTLKQKLASDDVELMKFSFDWLKFSLFGEKTLQIKS
jgi:Fe-S-cluster containining protein